jgi:membrane-associated protease RseP (regulator of RpoE activity)
VHAGFLGIRPALQRERQGVGYVASTMGTGTWETLKAIGAMPQKVYHVTRAAIGLEERDVNSPMSVVGAGRVAGEFASDDRNSLADRFFSVLLLLAGLNLFLGLVNLVPLPPFDGAGIATTLYEAARRGIARIRGRPDPGAVDAAKLLPVTYVVASLLILMTVILVYADIVAPVSIS